jgi:hypothetical protein
LSIWVDFIWRLKTIPDSTATPVPGSLNPLDLYGLPVAVGKTPPVVIFVNVYSLGGPFAYDWHTRFPGAVYSGNKQYACHEKDALQITPQQDPIPICSLDVKRMYTSFHKFPSSLKSVLFNCSVIEKLKRI